MVVLGSARQNRLPKNGLHLKTDLFGIGLSRKMVRSFLDRPGITNVVSRSFATALMVGLSREHSLPSLVSPPFRAAGPSGPLQGSGTLVNPSSVCSECFVGVGGGSWPGFEWLATTSLIIKVHTHH